MLHSHYNAFLKKVKGLSVLCFCFLFSKKYYNKIMYIFELISKLKKDYKEKRGLFSSKKEKNLSNEEDYTKCEHIFVPIDSTKKVLACSKCGIIVKRQN